jgi:hypothetical protein
MQWQEVVQSLRFLITVLLIDIERLCATRADQSQGLKCRVDPGFIGWIRRLRSAD